MALGMVLVPIGLLSTIGFLNAPLDISSAPAANLALGMGIDDTMIHMTELEEYRPKLKTPQAFFMPAIDPFSIVK
jgi:predicted RND superfamily exporter protein